MVRTETLSIIQVKFSFQFARVNDENMHINAFFKSALQHDPSVVYINLLKPTGHVMHQQFNIQQLYVLPTLYLCVLYLSENKQRLVPLTA